MKHFTKLKVVFFSVFLFSLFLTNHSNAQLAGNFTIPGDYANFTAAFNDLNALGVGPGGVTFRVDANSVFNEVPPVLNASGTSANPIRFEKNGAGNNPKITANVPGTLTATFGNNGDGIVIINGGDYITFENIDLDGNNTYVTTLEKYEYGYFFKKASATDASKNVSIIGCNITLYHNIADIVTSGSGIFVSNISGTASVTVTDAGGKSEFINLQGNTISGAYVGIQVRGFNSGSPYELYDNNINVGTVTGNNITNYGGGTGTAYGVYAIYQDSLRISNNTMVSLTTATTLYGIFTSTGVNSSIDINNNTVTINGGGTTSTIYGINNAMGGTGTDNLVRIFNNTFENSTYATATTGVFYGIYNTATALNVQMYNNIVRNNSRVGTSGATYWLYSSGSAASGNVEVYGNQVYGNTSTAATGDVFCLYVNEVATVNKNVYSNLIYNNSGGDDIYGINSTLGNNINIYKNIIYGISTTTALTTSPYCTGIQVSTGTNVYVYNNYVSHLTAPNSAATDAVRGISFTSATTNAIRGLYYNTIYLNATSSGVNFGSSGVYHIFSTTATSSTLDMRNNNIVNVSTANGTGFTAAFRRSAATNLNNYSTVSNNNNFYAGIPSASNVIYSDGTNHIQAMADFRTFVDPRESASITGLPPFINASTPPYNLRINEASPTQLESAGTPITTPIAINGDYDDTPRYPNMGYPFNPSYPPSAPDIGADEFAGIPADLTPPTISYNPLLNTASTGNRTLTATITDASGVVTGTNGPRLYYKKSTDPSYIFDNAPMISGDDYTFTLNTASLGGVSTGTIIQYYVAAQDSANNGGTQPAGGSGINPPGTTPPGSPASYTVVPSLSGTYTVGATGNYPSLTAVATLLSNQNAEVVGNVFFELQNDYDSTIVETVPIVFPEFVNAGTLNGTPFTVTIRPALGVTNRVTSGDPGANFAFPVINFVGGKHYILDGRPGGIGTSREWTIRNIRNTGTIGCVLRFADDGAYNTVRYCNIESQGNLTTTGNIFFHTSTGTIGNSFNLIENNMIRGRTDVPADSIGNGIYSNGSAAAPNTENFIQGNHIVNFRGAGISLVATNTGNGPFWNISNNHIYNETIVSGLTQTGISSASSASTDMTISGNFIGGSAPNATGMMTNSGNVLFTGISITGGIAEITGNTISNMTGTNTGTTARTRGITYTAPLDGGVIENNIISNLISNSSVVTGISASNQAATGMHIFPGSTFYLMRINDNTISNISSENTTAFPTVHMTCGAFLTNFKGDFFNNRIYGISNKSTGTTANQQPIAAGIYMRFVDSALIYNNMISIGSGENTNTMFAGMLIAAGTALNDLSLIYNTIAVSGTSGGDIGSYGFIRSDLTAVSPLTSIASANNAIVNTRSGGGSSNYSIAYHGADGDINILSNYNMYHSSDPLLIAQVNTTSYNFNGWKTLSGDDLQSVSPNTLTLSNLFTNVSTADLNVIEANIESWILNGNALPLNGIDFDFNGNKRSDSLQTGSSDIGADEFIPSVAPPTINITVAGLGSYPISLYGRTLGSVNLTNLGTLDAPISELNVLYYSGVNPPGSIPPYKYGNAYWDISPNPGASGYTYNVTLNYQPNTLGNIRFESEVRMIKSDNGGTSYTPYLNPGMGTDEYTLDTLLKTVTVYGLTSFSLFGITGSDGPLPVELSSFTATAERNNINLNWTTATEINNSGFDIERKSVGETEWSKIANIQGNGNSSEPKNYSYSDRNLSTGKYNYRLKQIDYNGNFEYFNLSSEISVGIPDNYDMSQNYPNPFNPATKINYDLPFDSRVSLKVYDMLGREVFSVLNNEQINAGYHTAQINFGSMASGTYFYRIIAKGVNGKEFVTTKKMVLVR
ncbi:MAG TPA: hypothetical protein PLG90_10745 [Ignavibacteria bacterium]|nr:hypothetical protein [Ignavibacteria bacterium]